MCLQLRLVKSTICLTGKPSEYTKTRMVRLLAGSSDPSSVSASGVPKTKSRRPAPQYHYLADADTSEIGSSYSSDGGVDHDPSVLEAGRMPSSKFFNEGETATNEARAAPRNKKAYAGEAQEEKDETVTDGKLAAPRNNKTYRGGAQENKNKNVTDEARAAPRNKKTCGGEAQGKKNKAEGDPAKRQHTKVDAAEGKIRVPWAWFSPRVKGPGVS